MAINKKRVEELTYQLLIELGEDPSRPGLVDTPRRVAKFWDEFISYQDDNMETTFESIKTDQLVIVSGMRVWSLCEHHLLPFYTDISIGYLTQKEVLGLSKFGRIAHFWAHRLQTQEQLVDQISKALVSLVGDDVAVLGQGAHLCMMMRGVKTPALMTTSSLSGRFLIESDLRAEFLSLTRRQHEPF